MAQVTRDIIQLKKSKTGDVFYPETHMQAVIGLNGNKDAKTVLAGPTSGSAGPASFRPLYPTDIIPLFTKEYTYKCTANDTNNGNIYFMNVTPTSDDWATPWSVHYTLQVDCLTSEDANSKYCHGFYDIYVGSAGSNYYYHVFNTFYSSSYYPVYYHKLLYHNTEAKYTSYHITNPVKLGARIQSAWGANTRTRIYNIKVYDYKNCTISFPENIEIYGDVYRDTYYNTIDLNATTTGLQETSDQNDTTTMNLYYTRLQAGTNGIKQYSLVMQDKNGKWQSFTKGAGGTATTKEKNDAEFRLGSRIYRMSRSSDLVADGYLSNGQVQAYCTLVDLRYSLNIVSNNSATGGSVGLTQYKPVYIVGTINSNGYFVLDDIWWTQDEPITEDGKIYIRVVDSVYLDNANNPNGQYRGDLISDGNAYYYKNGSFQRYVIAESANTVPWSGVTGRPSFYDLVIKASDATTLLTYKPITSGTYQLQLSASQIGLGNVENTKLSTWAGTSNITTLGTISTGTWHGSTIGVGYGGTGKTSWTQYGVLYADTTSSLSQVVNNTTSTRKFLRMVGSNNAATAPAWDTVTKTDVGLSNVENTALSTWAGTQNIITVGTITTGTWNATTISTSKGGTGLTTYTKGDMLYASANNTLAKLGANTGTKKFLSMASSVPSWEVLATTDLPAMYIGKTTVKFENTTEQALTGISTGAFSSSITVGNGSAPASNEQASTTQKRRIYFGSSNYYIEVDKNGYLHTNVGFYSDSFVSAGGLSNAGGSSGIDADALWELLATGTSEQINSSHLPKGSAADLNSGTSTTGVTWGAKTIADYVTSQINTTVSSALYFRGQSSTAITNGGTETATINGQALTAQTGDLVLYNGKEFAWDGSHWIQFGDESSWASKNISISTSGYLTGGGDLTTNRTISINTNKISDSSAASSLSSTSTNLVTERDIYYGLPTINNSHTYTSGTTIYAPTSAGTANQVLLSGGANTAPTWGNASGLSVGTASKLGSSTVGSTTKPIYLSSGTATECNTYAGGTAVTLNGTSKAASTASFYAPTGGGTANQVLIAGGNNTAPSWTNQSNLSVGTASKLGSATVGSSTIPIYLNAGTPTAITSFPEAYLSWGGKNLNGTYGPVDAAMVTALGANRASFANPAGVEISYSRDAGATWTDYGATDQQKRLLFTRSKASSASYVIGKCATNDVADANCQLKVTLFTSRAGIYTVLNKVVVYLSTEGSTGCNLTIRARTQANYESDTDTWVVFADSISISGWSGWNVINISNLTTYGNTKASQYGQIEFIFKATGYNGNGTTQRGLNINDIRLFGGMGWTTPSSMAFDGHIYSWDGDMTTIFPAAVRPQSNNTSVLGTSSARWSTVYGVNADFSGTGTISGNTTIGGTLTVGTSSANKATTLNGTLGVTGNTTLSGTLTVGTSSANKTTTLNGALTVAYGGATIKGSGNAVTNINGATATVDYAHIFVNGGNNNTRPLVLQNGYGNVGIGVTQPSYKLAVGGTFNATGLSTLSGGISLGTQYTPSGSSSAVDSKLVWDDTHKAWHLIGNFYADGFISAGGLSNSSGGGGVDIDAVWASLTNSVTDEYASTRIAQSHLPAISSSGSGVVSAIAYSGSGNSLVLSVTKTAVVTSLGSKTGTITLSGGLSIDSNNILSSTDNKVTQTATTTSATYELLFSSTADNTTRTEGARKTSTLTYNPSTKVLSTGGAVNGLTLSAQTTGFKISGGTTSKTLTVGADYTLGAACAKAVVTSIDTSASLPTSNAVKTFVEGKGYVTSSGVTSITLTSGTGITVSNSGTAITGEGSRTISLNVAGAKTALGLGTMAYETASNYLTTATAASTYVKLSPGTSEQTISSSISSFVKGVINLWRSSGDHYTFLGFSNGTTETYLGGIGFKSQSDHNLYRKDGSNYYTIFDENNYTSYVNTTNFPGLNKTGTVTKVSTGTGLTGGDITTTGTISINSTYQGYITHGESAYNSLGNYVLKAGDSMTGGLSIDFTPSSGYPADRTKAGLIVEDDTAATTENIRGGNIIISRGYSSDANTSAGAITFYGRRLSSGYRNGARIAAVGGTDGTSYDRIDLVFYASNNTNDSTPTFVEAMRIKANGDIVAPSFSGQSIFKNSIKLPNGSYINAESGYAMCGIGSGGETFYCGPGAEITNAFYLRSGNIDLTHYKAGTPYKIWDASNSGISTMPWACSTLTVGTSITLPNNISLLGTLTNSDTVNIAKISTSNNIVIGGSSFSNNVNLYGGNINFYAGGTTAIGSVSSSGLDVTGTVTASGIGTFDRVVLTNTGAVAHIEFTRASWNYLSTPEGGAVAFGIGGAGSSYATTVINSDGIRPGTKAVHSCGLPTAYWGSIYGQDLYLGGDTHNTAAGSIIFSEKLDSQRNGFKIAPVHAASANRVNLVFYRSNVGSSPYAPSWTTFMTLSYDGKVTIAGSLTTSGDQVISSDAALKKNLKDLNLTVEQIAQLPAVTFDWKDGRGSSFGTVAQSVLPIFPQAVRGEEGNYSVVYGQGGWVFGVKNARAIVDIQKHETEQDKEIRELNIKVKEQAVEISRLKELLKMNGYVN